MEMCSLFAISYVFALIWIMVLITNLIMFHVIYRMLIEASSKLSYTVLRPLNKRCLCQFVINVELTSDEVGPFV